MTIGDFTDQADAYARSRPGYPAELLDRLIDGLPVKPNGSVVDFGAGTGILTRMLLQRGFDVTAVEPNEQMAIRSGLRQVRWIQGTFEQNPLSTESTDWAVAAQAFHWADPSTALPNIARILKPACCFTVLWNNRSPSGCEVLDWTTRAIRRHVPEFDEAYRDKPWGDVLESTGDFVIESELRVEHHVPMSTERYLDLWRSHNRLNNIAGVDRFGSFFQELRDYLDQNQVSAIDLPYVCEAWSARRIRSTGG